MTDETKMTDMPYLFVSVIEDQVLLLVSPLITNFVSLQTGTILASISHTTCDAAPRCASWTSIERVSSADGIAKFDCLLALAFDHKELSVYRLNYSSSQSGDQEKHLSINKIWTENLPKRVTKIEWEQDISKSEKRIIVGDRHGDVRSYVVPIIENDQSLPPSKKQKLDGSTGESSTSTNEIETTKNAEEKEDIGILHVGHVSYLSDFVLSSFTSPTSSNEHTIPSFIITGDRDEHIRISRWGPRRAGYIALRYLLGSTQAIGSLCAVAGEAWQAVQSSDKINEIGKDRCLFPFLVSVDNSNLRLWSLHPDSKAKGRQDCLAVFPLEELLMPFTVVDSKRERRREQLFGKGRTKIPRQADGAPNLDEGEDHIPLLTPIVTKLRTFSDSEGQVYLVFTIDGGRALFTIPLTSLLSADNVDELKISLNILDCSLSILEYAIQKNRSDGEVDAWITLDVRREFIKNEEGLSKKPIRLARWNPDSYEFSFIRDDQHPVLQTQSNTLALQASWDDASSMVLYDALTMFNKRDVEYSDTVDVMSKDGLIKGGFPNHEMSSNNKGSKKNQQGEGLTRKREKAREEMKRRIESRINT